MGKIYFAPRLSSLVLLDSQMLMAIINKNKAFQGGVKFAALEMYEETLRCPLLKGRVWGKQCFELKQHKKNGGSEFSDKAVGCWSEYFVKEQTPCKSLGLSDPHDERESVFEFDEDDTYNPFF